MMNFQKPFFECDSGLVIHRMCSCFKKKVLVYHTFSLKIEYFKITLIHMSAKLNPREIFPLKE